LEIEGQEREMNEVIDVLSVVSRDEEVERASTIK